jgi:hypothetical protein
VKEQPSGTVSSLPAIKEFIYNGIRQLADAVFYFAIHYVLFIFEYTNQGKYSLNGKGDPDEAV